MASKGNKAVLNVNGSQYGWSSIQVLIGTTPVWGISSISYAKRQQGKNSYGLSTTPIGQAFGIFEYEASMTFYQDEFAALEVSAKALGYDTLQDMPPLDITIIYQAPASTKTKTDVLKNVNFMDYSISTSEGDLENMVECSLLIQDVVNKI